MPDPSHADILNRRALLLLASMCLTPSVFGQPDSVDAPTLREGDRWKFQTADGFTGLVNGVVAVRVVSVKADGYVVERTVDSNAPETIELTPGLNVRQAYEGLPGDAGEFDFPLRIGKRWKSRTLQQSPTTRATNEVDLEREVVALEKVTVPAGEFDAWKIVGKGKWTLKANPDHAVISDGSGRYESIVWYAPAVKRIVAVNTSAYAGGRLSRRIKIALTEFELH